MKQIIYNNPDGSVSIIIPAPKALLFMTIEEIQEKDVPKGVSSKIINIGDLPADRTFRNAWEFKAGKIIPDLAKSKEIAHWHRREDRKEKFAPHDEIIAKQIPGKSAATAETARQKIRDDSAGIQVNIDNAKTTDDLLAITLPLVNYDR